MRKKLIPGIREFSHNFDVFKMTKIYDQLVPQPEYKLLFFWDYTTKIIFLTFCFSKSCLYSSVNLSAEDNQLYLQSLNTIEQHFKWNFRYCNFRTIFAEPELGSSGAVLNFG